MEECVDPIKIKEIAGKKKIKAQDAKIIEEGLENIIKKYYDKFFCSGG